MFNTLIVKNKEFSEVDLDTLLKVKTNQFMEQKTVYILIMTNLHMKE